MKKKYALLFFLLLTVINMKAQWVQTNGPEGGTIYCLVTDGTNLFAGTSSGVYRSTNNGTSWTSVNNGINFNFRNKKVRSLAISAGTIYAGTQNDGIFVSQNNGATWIGGSGVTSKVNAFVISGSTVFAGTSGGAGIYQTINNGTSWVPANNGLINGTRVNALAINGASIFAGTDSNGVYVSGNNGLTWSFAGLPTMKIRSLIENNSKIYAGTSFGVYLSTNNGVSWPAINVGISTTSIYSLAFNGTQIYAGSDDGVYKSTNNGLSWSTVNTGLSNKSILSLLNSGSDVFAGTDGAGIFFNATNGASWVEKNIALFGTQVNTSISMGANIYVGTAGAGIFISSDNGVTYSKVNNGLGNLYVRKIAIHGSNIFACTNGGLFLSTNNGSNWNNISTGIGTNVIINCILFIGSDIFCGVNNSASIYYSNDAGVTWTNPNSGLGNHPVLSLAIKGNTLLAGTSGFGVFKSTDYGLSWVSSNLGLTGTVLNINSMEIKGNDIIAGTNNGIFMSSDTGFTWVSKLGASNFDVRPIEVSGGSIFAGIGEEVKLSNDNGATWDTVSSGLPYESIVWSLNAAGSTIYAGTYEGLWKRPIFEMTGTNFSIADSIVPPSCNGGSNGSIAISVSGGIPPYNYSWSPLGGTNSIASGLTAGHYTVYIQDSLQVTDSLQVDLLEPPPIYISLSSTPSSTCYSNNGTAAVTASGGTMPYGYSWSNSLSGDSISGLIPGTYIVSVSDANSCTSIDSITVSIDSTFTPAAPLICLVTVDSLSLHNVIVWEKDPLITYIDSFRIYRLDASTYHYVASVSYSQLSEYTDIDPTADPQGNIRRYKMATVDVCGNVSSLSNYHTTILLTDFSNGIFQYSPYDIQNQSGTIVQQYLLQRLDSSSGIWTSINFNPGSVTGTIIAPNYAQYSFSSYRVLADLGNYTCTPTARIQSGISVIRSNIKNKALSIRNSNKFDSQVTFQPNPARDVIHIVHSITLDEINVYDCMGRELISQASTNSKAGNITLDISELASGVYTIVCKGKEFEVRKKLVVD